MYAKSSYANSESNTTHESYMQTSSKLETNDKQLLQNIPVAAETTRVMMQLNNQLSPCIPKVPYANNESNSTPLLTLDGVTFIS